MGSVTKRPRIAKVRETFKPIEPLLPEGDTLDYNRTVFFTGKPNDTSEHIVVVPLTRSSISLVKAQRIGVDLTWEDAGPVTIRAIYILPPNDFTNLEAGKPYLQQAVSWEKAITLDASGTVVKEIPIVWLRGCREEQSKEIPLVGQFQGEWHFFRGKNEEYHGIGCVVITTNQ
jgi:hypothetical protein